ncbi:hypothetical protein K504DRAFT_454746 [Pleomassaria siparia CBS 279.74]|uniref:Uncharacterized protein n=1 Tax=Pleomassaria siparia CBS 279.74 TaxID=1314801 RepID=A0A6G1KCB9_9PLEO|nr:hypothetical protein K504DRAFT_454746 [Pleomassaria siparia CBS 279.74]
MATVQCTPTSDDDDDDDDGDDHDGSLLSDDIFSRRDCDATTIGGTSSCGWAVRSLLRTRRPALEAGSQMRGEDVHTCLKRGHAAHCPRCTLHAAHAAVAAFPLRPKRAPSCI